MLGRCLNYDTCIWSNKTDKTTSDCNKYVTPDSVQNLVVKNAPGTGGFGGTCTCPNGEIYQVADNNDSCGSFACINGISGNVCYTKNGPWSNKKVICSLPVESPPSSENTVQENVTGVGGSGGVCACPDGGLYFAGDNKDNCGSLACVNGRVGEVTDSKGKCFGFNGPWSGKKVTCSLVNNGEPCNGNSDCKSGFCSNDNKTKSASTGAKCANKPSTTI